MKNNAFIKIALIVVASSLFLFVTYCGTDPGNDDSVPVSITFNIPSVKEKVGRVLSAPSPSIVNSITVTISAADMTTISDTFNVSAGTAVSKSYFVDPGTERTFTAYAYDGTLASGFLIYQGTSIDDLVAGASTTVVIAMAEAPYTGLYVDVNRGVDVTGGSPLNPFKTITFALSQTGGSEPINVAAGLYNTVSGEAFPLSLQLKTGTALKCVGAGYTTVIDFANDYSTAILGADGASVEGCKITNAGPAVDDAGKQMTVNNNFMEGGCLGIYAQGNSTISNNIIRAMGGGECENAGIFSYSAAGDHTPTILNNTITANDAGISVQNGILKINNNTLSCNNSYDLRNDSASNIDATNNRWDNSPPRIVEGNCTYDGEDICDFVGSTVDFTGYTLSPSPCTP